MTEKVTLVYDYDGRKPASGRRAIWIDPDTDEVFLLTGDKDEGGSINQTKRKLKVAVEHSEIEPPKYTRTFLFFGENPC